MKAYLIIGVVAAACVAALLAPHHRKQDISFNPRTLAGIYGGLFGALPEAQGPRVGVFVLLLLAGVLSAAYPVVLAITVTANGPQPSDAVRSALVIAGVVCLGGALVNLLLMLMAGMTFGFGGGTSVGEVTPFVWITPAFQAIFALASIIIGISSCCASAASRVFIGGA